MSFCLRFFGVKFRHHYHQLHHFTAVVSLLPHSPFLPHSLSTFRSFSVHSILLSKQNKSLKMGITGLLPLMKPATSDVKLAKLSGTVAAIDTNGWIHRACYSCGDKVYLKEETDMYINYCINLCEVLRKHDITPILVFDGQSLPAKSETKAKRQKRKAEVRQKIEEMLAAGDNRGARWLMRQCVDVTFEMIHRVIVRCRAEKIDCILAPFEADAQITYLVNKGVADYAITEDSDLLVFGCQKVLYKLDRENEKGSMLDMTKLGKCFKNFCEKRFQYMCVLSGCDYLSNIPNVGLGRARKFFESLNSVPMSLEAMRGHLKTIPTVLNMVGKVKVTEDYIDAFVRAVQTFDHQLVYCPFTGQLTHLKSLQGGLDRHRELRLGEFAGEFFQNLDQDEADFIAHYVCGNLHTKTLEKMDNEFSPIPDDCTELGSWFTENVQQRVSSKKSMVTMISKGVTQEVSVVPESPRKTTTAVKAKSETVQTNGESKRKMGAEKKPPTSVKRVKQTQNSSPVKVCVRSTSTRAVVKTVEKDSIIEQEMEEVSVTSENTENRVTNKREGVTRTTRNVFRRTSTEQRSVITGGRSSAYFNKTSSECTLEVDEIVDNKDNKRHCSPMKKSTVTSTLITVDSDSDDDEFAELRSNGPKKAVDLNASISSLDEEDSRILSSLNGSGTQSSGYYSQNSTQRSQRSMSSQSTLKSPAVGGRKSSQSQSSSSRASTGSKRSTRSASNAVSATNTKDIRTFFTKRT